MPVDPTEQDRIKELIAQIQVERNPQAFTALIDELNRLLEGYAPPHKNERPKIE
jgi:hypothetical protein